MAKTRVLIVEDSLTVRKYLAEVLGSDPDLEVIGEAEDGRRAIELCLALRPDVITLDMMLPIMSGVAVTEYVMAFCPVPILVVSASTNRGELYKTYDALAAGALDVLEKPTGDPAAIVEILRGLPSDFPVPILLVIHISRIFGGAFAEWLDAQSKLRVRYAKDGERLPTSGQPGVLMAP